MKLVAHIGMSMPPSKDDLTRYACTLAAASRYWPRGCCCDVINLDFGHDFLRLSCRYDAILIHSVFHANDPIFKLARPLFAVSPFHTIDRWKRCLVKTEAKVIAVYEGIPFALNGWQLGALPGYRITVRDHILTVYVRNGTRGR